MSFWPEDLLVTVKKGIWCTKIPYKNNDRFVDYEFIEGCGSKPILHIDVMKQIEDQVGIFGIKWFYNFDLYDIFIWTASEEDALKIKLIIG